MNHRLRCPSFSSPVFSAHATLPAGYSPLPHISHVLSQYDRSRVPNANPQQKSPCRQSLEHAIDSPATIRARAESCENKEDDGRGQQTPFARVMIARPAKEQLPDDGTSKGDGGDILLSRVAGVLFPVDGLEEGVDLANDPRSFVRRIIEEERVGNGAHPFR